MWVYMYMFDSYIYILCVCVLVCVCGVFWFQQISYAAIKLDFERIKIQCTKLTEQFRESYVSFALFVESGPSGRSEARYIHICKHSYFYALNNAQMHRHNHTDTCEIILRSTLLDLVVILPCKKHRIEWSDRRGKMQADCEDSCKYFHPLPSAAFFA